MSEMSKILTTDLAEVQLLQHFLCKHPDWAEPQLWLHEDTQSNEQKRMLSPKQTKNSFDEYVFMIKTTTIYYIDNKK